MGVVATVLPLLLQILESLPSAVEDVKNIWATATSQEAPTAEQQAQVDAALEAAHKALQSS